MASYPSGLRDRFAKPLFAGSNPADASLKLISCLGGGIGRHYGLKIRWQQCRAGSSPAPGTDEERSKLGLFLFLHKIAVCLCVSSAIALYCTLQASLYTYSTKQKTQLLILQQN